MFVAGCDYSTRHVDFVLLELDSDKAEWHRFDLSGADAFERARSVALAVPSRAMSWWDSILGIGLEEPRGPGNGALLRIQGAILACVPASRLVQPWVPSSWRKTVGLPGNASKYEVAKWALDRWEDYPFGVPLDATDAFCIALATRNRLQHSEAA